MASEGLGGEAARIEDFRALLPRSYGYELSKDLYALYLRIPALEVTNLSQEGLLQMERVLSRWEPAIKEETETTFVIADRDFVEISTERFLTVLHNKDVGPLREAVRDLLQRLESGRDGRLRRILNEISQKRERELLSSVRHGGRAATRLVVGKRGRVVGYRAATPDGASDIAVLPTVRAAIRRGAKVGTTGGHHRLQVSGDDIQENIRSTRIGSYLALVIDTSTYDEEVREQTEGVVNSLLLDAYERRDRVGLIHSTGDRAIIVSDFTTDLEDVRNRFLGAHWGGLSPFASGVMAGARLFQARLADTIDTVRILILVTTGRANIPMVQGGNTRRELVTLPHTVAAIDVNLVLVDATVHGSPFLREFARECGGSYYHPGSVRYHKVALANEMLSSFGEGKTAKAVEVGKAFLEKMSRGHGA